MVELRTIQWEEVSESADSLFRVWTDGRELQWAKRCWLALSKHRLTSYTNQVERASVIVRLIALADIYRKFCDLAFDEAYEPEYTVWAGELNLEVFRVAQYVGPQFEGDEGEDTENLFDQALLKLVEYAKSPIYQALKAEFGDDSFLFVSLWNTVDHEKNNGDGTSAQQKITTVDEGREIDWAEDAYSILNVELAGQKQQAFNWVCNGFRS